MTEQFKVTFALMVQDAQMAWRVRWRPTGAQRTRRPFQAEGITKPKTGSRKGNSLFCSEKVE